MTYVNESSNQCKVSVSVRPLLLLQITVRPTICSAVQTIINIGIQVCLKLQYPITKAILSLVLQ